MIANREDYLWAVAKLWQHQLHQKVSTVWFSPMFNVYANRSPDVPSLATDLAEWILQDNLPVRFQLQLHKIIWADAKGK